MTGPAASELGRTPDRLQAFYSELQTVLSRIDYDPDSRITSYSLSSDYTIRVSDHFAYIHNEYDKSWEHYVKIQRTRDLLEQGRGILDFEIYGAGEERGKSQPHANFLLLRPCDLKPTSLMGGIIWRAINQKNQNVVDDRDDMRPVLVDLKEIYTGTDCVYEDYEHVPLLQELAELPKDR